MTWNWCFRSTLKLYHIRINVRYWTGINDLFSFSQIWEKLRGINQAIRIIYNFSVLFPLYRKIYHIKFISFIWEIVEESPAKLCYLDFLDF
jgi:hypothetical protein